MKLKDLIVSPCNVRVYNADDNVKGLGNSIDTNKLISRLVLRKGKDGKIEVVAGSRRYRALVDKYGDDYDLPETDYVVRELDDKEAFLLSISENQERVGLTPMELNRAALRLNHVGFKEPEICKALSITQHRLKRIATLAADKKRMPEVALQELNKTVDEAKFNDAHWSKVRDVEDDDVVKDVVDYIIDKEAPPRDVPGIITAIQKKHGAMDNTKAPKAPSDTGAPDDTGGPISYDHKGELVLEEKDGKMTFRVKGKEEDEEVPVDHYLEFLRHPEKFKCRVTLKLKFTPLD